MTYLTEEFLPELVTLHCDSVRLEREVLDNLIAGAKTSLEVDTTYALRSSLNKVVDQLEIMADKNEIGEYEVVSVLEL